MTTTSPIQLSSPAQSASPQVAKRSLYGRLTFSWVYPWVKRARRERLTTQHLYAPITNDHLPGVLTRRLQDLYQRVYPGKLLRAMWQFLLPYYVVQILTELISDVMTAQLAGWNSEYSKLYEEVIDTPRSKEHLYLVLRTVRNVAAQLGPSLIEGFSYMRIFEVGLKLRLALVGSIIEHAYAMVPSRLLSRYVKTGLLINLVSVDTQILQDAAVYVSAIVSLPLKCFVFFDGVQAALKGASFTALKYGLFTMLAYVLIQVLLGRILTTVMTRLMQCCDLRVQLTQELVHGIKCVKQLGLEGVVTVRIARVRARELRYIRAVLILKTVSDVLHANIHLITQAVSLVAFLLTGTACAASDLDMLRNVQEMLFERLFEYVPQLIDQLPKCVPSFKRLRLFLSDDHQSSSASAADSVATSAGIYAEKVQFAVTARSVASSPSPKLAKLLDLPSSVSTSSKDEEPQRTALTSELNLSLDLDKDPRQIVLICGPNGCGKSTMLEGLAGNLSVAEGSCRLVASTGRNVGYLMQQPWILDATIRDNVLVGRSFDAQLYALTLQQCHLIEDLQEDEHGDEKVCGPQGSMLSGGQKQRVALARLAYGRPQVALLDDAFSALDRRVRAAILQDLILDPKGLLHGTTLIVSAPSAAFLGPVAHQIIRLDVAKKIAAHTVNAAPQTKLLIVSSSKSSASSTTATTSSYSDDTPLLTKVKDEKAKRGEEEGYALLKILGKYALLSGGFLTIIILLTLVAMEQVGKIQVNSVTRNYILKGSTFSWVIREYVLFISLVVYAQLMFGLFMAMAHTVAVKRLHDRAIRSAATAKYPALQASTPARLLGFFSRDQRIADLELTSHVLLMMGFLSGFILSIIECARTMPTLLPLVAGMFALAGGLQYLYTAAWRQARELMSAHNAALVAQFDESLEGLAVLGIDESPGTLQMREHLKHRLYAELQDLGVANHFLLVVRRWMTMRYEWIRMISTLSIDLACIAFRIAPDTRSTTARLLITVAKNFERFAKCFAAADEAMISCSLIEQVQAYPSEDIIIIDEHDKNKKRDDKKKPIGKVLEEDGIAAKESRGAIEFEGVEMSYGSVHVLKGVSFAVRPGEKVAIVGRTGAGKSSLLSALYRLQDKLAGTIRVHGKDTYGMPLSQLRAHLALVPQEPTLFSGTVRFNLDPKQKGQEDAHLWDALKTVGLAAIVSTLPQKLDSDLADCRLSGGQQQLLCLARALLSLPSSPLSGASPSSGPNSCRGGILCLDEATSNGDDDTNGKLVECVLGLQGTTVLAIMHNLQGIERYDRVLVMDAGRVIENGSFQQLMALDGGVFRAIYRQSSA